MQVGLADDARSHRLARAARAFLSANGLLLSSWRTQADAGDALRAGPCSGCASNLARYGNPETPFCSPPGSPLYGSEWAGQGHYGSGWDGGEAGLGVASCQATKPVRRCPHTGKPPETEEFTEKKGGSTRSVEPPLHMVGDAGIEPATSCMSSRHSNQLS